MVRHALRTILLAAVCLVAAGAAPPSAGPLPRGVAVLPADALGALRLLGAAGLAEVQTVPVQGQPFDKALRIRTVRPAPNSWAVQLHAPNATPVKKGDVLLATFYLRCAESMTGEAHTVLVFERGRDPWTKSAEFPASAGSTWRKVQVPFACREDYAPGEAGLNLHAGFGPQVMEIGGLGVTNLGREVRVRDLPTTSFTYAGREPDAPWRQDAARRIDEIRKGDLVVEVVGADGKPVAGATVRAAMKRHAFGFGSAVAADGILDESDSGQKYRDAIRALFNKVVFENDLKWTDWGWENPQRRARMFKALDWLQAQGIAVRGHCLVWPSWRNMPKDVQGLKDDKDALRRRILDHVREEVRALKGRLVEWDVINEPYSNHDVMDILGNECMVEWFKAAREEDPDVRLFLNDYSILTGGGRDTAHQGHYEKTLRYVLEQGAPIGGIGLQGHFGRDVTAPAKLLEILDRFGSLGPVLEVTEFDVDTTDEALQADYMRDFLTTLFSHPKVTGILMWGFWEGRHWKPTAALFRRDWTLRPHGQVWKDLVLKAWWTDETGRTDAAGRFRTRGFLGDYDVTVEHAGRTRTVQAGLEKPSKTVTVTLD